MPEVEHVCDRVASSATGALAAVEDMDEPLRRRRSSWSRFGSRRRRRRVGWTASPGVREAVAFGDRVPVTMAGPIDPLVKAPRAVTRSWTSQSREPSLEEVFLTFYATTEDHG